MAPEARRRTQKKSKASATATSMAPPLSRGRLLAAFRSQKSEAATCCLLQCGGKQGKARLRKGRGEEAHGVYINNNGKLKWKEKWWQVKRQSLIHMQQLANLIHLCLCLALLASLARSVVEEGHFRNQTTA